MSDALESVFDEFAAAVEEQLTRMNATIVEQRAEIDRLRTLAENPPAGPQGDPGADGIANPEEMAAVAARVIGEFLTRSVALEGRTLTIAGQALPLPIPVYRGVWEAGVYERGDMVTSDGSTWHCNAETTEAKPGEGADWQMAVRKGKDASRR